MEELSFKLQVVTPLFMSGADQQKAELRPPSIRGALRFWFRAMMGGVVGGDWGNVKKLEDIAFGSTKQASRWQIRFTTLSPRVRCPEESVGVLPEGVLYLGFNLFRRGRRSSDRPSPDTLTRACFWPSSGEDFQLQFRFFGSETSLQQVILGAFWLLLHCGGLGARVRRGFGGLALSGDGEPVDLRWGWPREDTANFFRCQLSKIAKFYAQFAKAHNVEVATEDVFSQQGDVPFSCFARWKGVIVSPEKSWGSWEEALGALGDELRMFRQDPSAASKFGATHDYRVIAPFLDCKLSGTQDLNYDSFGLPIQYRSMSRTRRAQKDAERQGWNRNQARKLQVRAILQARRQVEGRLVDIDRRASPLFLRPIRFKASEPLYGGLFILFDSKFLPSGAEEVLQPVESGWPPFIPKPEPVQVKGADLNIIYKFLSNLKNKYDVTDYLP